MDKEEEEQANENRKRQRGSLSTPAGQRGAHGRRGAAKEEEQAKKKRQRGTRGGMGKEAEGETKRKPENTYRAEIKRRAKQA